MIIKGSRKSKKLKSRDSYNSKASDLVKTVRKILRSTRVQVSRKTFVRGIPTELAKET